jgi:hypothetical protein
MFPRMLEIKKNLQLLKDKLKKIEKHIHNLIQTTQRFKQIEDILVTVPGIGNRSITGLLCYLPELGKVTHKQITALCGLALYVCDSGQMRGKASTATILFWVLIDSGIERHKFYSCVHCCESPVNTGTLMITLLYPSAHFLMKSLSVWNSPIQTLAT